MICTLKLKKKEQATDPWRIDIRVDYLMVIRKKRPKNNSIEKANIFLHIVTFCISSTQNCTLTCMAIMNIPCLSRLPIKLQRNARASF